MMCECFKIGGPFIAEDPDCPAHGIEAQRRQQEQENEAAAMADEIDRLRSALEDARAGFALAYDAAEKGFTDEVLLHCGHNGSKAAKALRPNAESNGGASHPTRTPGYRAG